MSRLRGLFLVVSCVTVLVGLPAVVPAQQEGEVLEIAIPTDVYVVAGQSLVLITGRPTSGSPVNCASGVSHPVSAVIVDEGGGNAAQQTGVLVFRGNSSDSAPRPGTRIRIVAGPAACNGDLNLWQGVVE